MSMVTTSILEVGSERMNAAIETREEDDRNSGYAVRNTLRTL